MTILVILGDLAWVLAITAGGVHYGVRPVTRRAARWIRHQIQPPRRWVRDSRCGCAWTTSWPVIVEPCARHAGGYVRVLKPYEVEMRDLSRLIRRTLPPQKAHQ